MNDPLVGSSRLFQLVAHPSIFRLFMKGKFDAYVLWSLAQRVQNWIVDRSTARNFTVYNKLVGLVLTLISKYNLLRHEKYLFLWWHRGVAKWPHFFLVFLIFQYYCCREKKKNDINSYVHILGRYFKMYLALNLLFSKFIN